MADETGIELCNYTLIFTIILAILKLYNTYKSHKEDNVGLRTLTSSVASFIRTHIVSIPDMSRLIGKVHIGKGIYRKDFDLAEPQKQIYYHTILSMSSKLYVL